MGIDDEYALAQIKQKLGGSIKKRSGAQALRYRLHNRKGIHLLLNLINGNIYNPIRIIQLKKILEKLDLNYIVPKKRDINNGWFAGF